MYSYNKTFDCSINEIIWYYTDSMPLYIKNMMEEHKSITISMIPNLMVFVGAVEA